MNTCNEPFRVKGTVLSGTAGAIFIKDDSGITLFGLGDEKDGDRVEFDAHVAYSVSKKHALFVRAKQ